MRNGHTWKMKFSLDCFPADASRLVFDMRSTRTDAPRLDEKPGVPVMVLAYALVALSGAVVGFIIGFAMGYGAWLVDK